MSTAVNNNNHGRGYFKEIVSSYVQQAKRPATNIGQNFSNLSGGGVKSSSIGLTGVAVNSTGVSSANVKTGGKLVNQQMIQKSLLAYQSTELNAK